MFLGSTITSESLMYRNRPHRGTSGRGGVLPQHECLPSTRSKDSRRCHSIRFSLELRMAAIAFFVTVISASFALTTREPHKGGIRPGHEKHATFLTRETSLKAQQDEIESKHGIMNRREALFFAAAAIVPLALTTPPQAAAEVSDCPVNSLENLVLGEGQWTQASLATMKATDSIIPPTFVTYASRYLIRYDEGVCSWWNNMSKSYSLLPLDQRQEKLGKSFGCLAMSLQLALDQFLQANSSSSNEVIQKRFGALARLFLDKYGDANAEARRQVGVLLALLPAEHQPADIMKGLATASIAAPVLETAAASPPPKLLSENLAALLPPEFHCAQVKGTQIFVIEPPISLYEVGVDEEFGQTAIATAFGPLSSTPLRRELPDYTADIYALFGISGATGCALTHTVVIPLDVVKTRIQTDPEMDGGGILQSAASIVEREGIQALLLGAQATIAGYLWYGASVYPSYAFFKRFITQSVLPPEVATVHMNDVALLAGAMASVIASIGLTPLEACRIRTVANPERYKPIGLVGTLNVISSENAELGWRALYAGLPSLLTRQVIFGSIKFLAFERASEAIFKTFPALHDATWTALCVSLVAGGISGALSSVVSQPADSVLTYVAQNSGGQKSLGVIEGSLVMVEKEGVGSLFRGLGSRCVWAGSIIAGQFLLYDVFRTFFGVNGDDLSQVFKVVISGQ